MTQTAVTCPLCHSILQLPAVPERALHDTGRSNVGVLHGSRDAYAPRSSQSGNPSLSKMSPEQLLRMFPTTILGRGSGHGTDADVCMVCLADLVVGDQVTRLPCMHLLHEQCLAMWLSQGNLCPICNTDLDIAVRLSMEGSGLP